MKKSFVPWSQDEASTSTAYSAVMRHDKLLVLKTGSDCRYNFCVCPALINNSPDDTLARYHWAKAEQVNSRHPAKYWKKSKKPGNSAPWRDPGNKKKKKKILCRVNTHHCYWRKDKSLGWIFSPFTFIYSNFSIGAWHEGPANLAC